MKKKLITVLTLLLCGSLWFSACSEKEQTPARTAQYQMFFYAFEDIMKDSDVLFVGECIRAELKTPNAEYTRYTFRIERDLGENLYCEEIVYDMPNGVALGPRNYGTRIGEEFFSVGETYLLPMVCEEIVLERHYNLCTFGIRMNLTTGVHQLMGQTIETPEGMGIEEFALSEYRKYPHKTFSPPKEYASEFDEFLGESVLIVRVRVYFTSDTIEQTRSACQVLELLRGDPEKLMFSRREADEDQTVYISCILGTVKKGREYIIGIKNIENAAGWYYTVSTRTAVKPVSKSLIEQIRSAN